MHVKETGFFAGRIDNATYDRLYGSSEGVRVEVDSSLATAQGVVERIRSYDSQMRVALVLRDPVAFAVSRYIHGLRKGDIQSQDIVQAIRSDVVLRAELDYDMIVSRFRRIAGTRVFRFEDIRSDGAAYYSSIRTHLTGLAPIDRIWQSSPVNEARVTAARGTTTWLARQATVARRYGLHRLVNAAKAARLHTLLERPLHNAERRELTDRAATVIHEEFPLSLVRYNEVVSCVS